MAGRLHRAPSEIGITSFLIRAGIIVALLFGTVLVLYFEEGLVDSKTNEEPNFLDCVYFALVTITTVGYGDIVPVTTQARLVDAFLLTPVRFVVLFTFIGTAYQVALRRFTEEYRMNRAVANLRDHIVVCGYGATGKAAVEELLLQGTPPEQIVLIEKNTELLDQASEREIVTIEGDATRESVLRSVAIERAKYILVSPGRDDTAVLISLTATDLNPTAHVVAMCLDEANIKFLQRSGVDTIVSRAAAGGHLLAAATRRMHLVNTMQDLLSFGGALRMDERTVTEQDAGKNPSELPGILVIRVYRHGHVYEISDFPTLEAGDAIVYLAPSRKSTPERNKSAV